MEDSFLKILPQIEQHGRIFFRHIKCRQTREEFIAEMVALAWRRFVRLTKRGKDVSVFIIRFCRFVAYAVKAGRRLCGHEKPKDVMSPVAQQNHGFTVNRMPDHSPGQDNPLAEALHENMVSAVPDQVAFRIDFPEWRKSYWERDRRIIDDLMMGERTLDLSRKYGCCPARISQKREQFKEEWDRYCGELAAA